jgi:serine/threonine-protein kinase
MTAMPVGRYLLYGEIASGGMATVHLGKLHGPVGFSRTVAIKRLHSQYANDSEVAGMLIDEARMVAHVRHPNVVPTFDVVKQDKDLFLVMEYVHGAPLSRLVRAARDSGDPIPRNIISAIMCGVLLGLHAAHDATNDEGQPLEIVHRDVSPENVLVGADGIARVLDFGVAKAVGRMHTTRDGQLRGKLAYMAPEQIRAETADRRTDVYGAGVVLWEMLTQKRLFEASNEGALLSRVLERIVEPPSALATDISEKLDLITLKAISRDPAKRFASTREMALALEEAVPIASPARVGQWVESLVGEELAERVKNVAKMESRPNSATKEIPTGSIALTTSNRPGARSDLDQDSRPTKRLPVVVSRVGWTWVALAATGGAVLALGGARLQRGARENPVADPPAVSIAPPTSEPAPVPEPSSAPAVSASVAAAPATSTGAPANSRPLTKGPARNPHTGAKPSSSAPAASPAAAAPGSAAAPPAASGEKVCPVRAFVDADGIKHFVRSCE